MTQVKKSVPRREDRSSLSFVPGLGISFTDSNSIFVPGPCKNWRYALEACGGKAKIFVSGAIK